MFENQSQPQPQNPLNPVMPAPGMQMTGSMPQAAPPPPPPPLPNVHTMPERFRSAGGGGPKGSSTTKKLVITLIVVVVLAGLGFGAMYVFNNVLVNDTTNATNEENLNAAENLNAVDENLNANAANLNANAALNENVNAANANAAANLNANTNANTNAAANTNASNTNTAVATSPLPSSTDTDADGLTDIEEVVYGTDAAKPDTDGDTFADGKKVQTDGTIVGELYLGYNPKGTGQLEGSTLVTRQQNGSHEYSLLAPATWTLTNDSSGGMLVSPTQQTGEFIQVRINDNPSRQTPKQWYQTANPTAQIDALTTVAVNGLEGIISEDASTVYLFKDAKVYGITYATGSLNQVNYRTTFEMMYRSFKLVAASS